MPRGTIKSPAVGARVQIPAYSDLWMRGARFGIVKRVQLAKPGVAPHRDLFGVQMDHPQVTGLAWFVADDCSYAREAAQ